MFLCRRYCPYIVISMVFHLCLTLSYVMLFDSLRLMMISLAEVDAKGPNPLLLGQVILTTLGICCAAIQDIGLQEDSHDAFKALRYLIRSPIKVHFLCWASLFIYMTTA